MNEDSLQSRPDDWKRVDGINSGVLKYEAAGAFRRVFYRHTLSPSARNLSGRRILFFSDLHIRPQTARAFPGSLAWRGTEHIRNFLLETTALYHPDHIFFGGDLMAYACCFAECAELFHSLQCPGRKLGVYGNWDLMRPWLPDRDWRRAWEQNGLHLLVNSAVQQDGMRIFGLDDYRKGNPEYVQPRKPYAFECVLAHNPDTVPLALSPENLYGIDLILCGHTHGGQIRLPGFGALMTSSRHWKKFEYGLYEHHLTRTRLFVSAGLGVTFIRQRILCPPEAVIIDLGS